MRRYGRYISFDAGVFFCCLAVAVSAGMAFGTLSGFAFGCALATFLGEIARRVSND